MGDILPLIGKSLKSSCKKVYLLKLLETLLKHTSSSQFLSLPSVAKSSQNLWL